MIPSAPDNIADALMMVAKSARNEMFLADEDIAFVNDVADSAKDYDLEKLVNEKNRDDIRESLCYLLSIDDQNIVADYLNEYRELIIAIIPELEESIGYVQGNKNHTEDLWTHLVETVRYIKKPNAAFRLEALLHDAGKPACQEIAPDGNATYFGHMEKSAEIVTEVMTRLGFTTEEIDRYAYIASIHDYKLKEFDDSVRWFRARYGNDFELRDDLLDHMEADVLGRGELTQHVREYYDRFNEGKAKAIAADKADVEKFGHSTIEQVRLVIDTPTLDSAGYHEYSRDYLTVINRCLDGVIDGEWDNDKEVLIKVADKKFAKIARSRNTK